MSRATWKAVLQTGEGTAVAPTAQPITIAQGETFDLYVECVRDNNEPVDLTSLAVLVAFGYDPADLTQNVEALFLREGTLVSPGLVRARVTAAETATFKARAGYHADAFFLAAPGNAYGLDDGARLQGVRSSRVRIEPGVAAPDADVTSPASEPPLGLGPTGATGQPRVVQNAGTPLTARDAVNFVAPLVATDNSGANRTDVALADSGVIPGSYTNASVTFDVKGRATAASSGQVRPTEYSVLPTLPDAAFPLGVIIRDPFQRLYVNRANAWAMVDNDNVVHALDVRFGAKGDGVTDDTAALQAAGNYALSTGRWLLLDKCVGYYCAGSLTFTVDQTTQPNSQGGSSEFAIIGYGQASPIIVACGAGHDFITHSASAVEWHQFRVQDVFATTPDTTVTDPACDRFINDSETHGDPLVGTAIFRNVRLGAVHCAIETIRCHGGAFLIDDPSFQGCASPRHIHADQAVSVVVNNPRSEYEFKWDGDYSANGTCSSLMHITPHSQTTSRSEVVVRGAVCDARTNLLLNMANTADFVGNVEISDFTADCSDGLLNLINCRRVNIFDGEYTNTGTQLLAGTLNPGNVTIKNVRAPGHGITVNDDGPATSIVLEDCDITDATNAPGLGVYGYTGGHKVVCYRRDAGVWSHGCLADGSIAAGQLVKPNPSGFGFIALTTSDDASVATGISLDTVSSGQWFRSVEVRGSVVTAKTDGAAIAKGALAYASAGTAGVVSATVAGGRAGIAYETSDDTAHTVKLLWSPSAAASGGGGVSPPTWHVVGAGGEPAFQNGWGAGSNPGFLRFSKDAMDIVRIEGSYASGTPSTVLFTLPAGYRPPGNRVLIADHDAGFARIEILTTGDVLLLTGGSSFCFMSVWFSVDA